MTHAVCSGIARHGGRCGARPITGTGYCLNHSPDISDEQRREWHSRGGKNSAAIIRAQRQLPNLATMLTADVRALMGVVLRGVIAGSIDPPVANAAANVARALGELARVQADELISDSEQLLDELEGRRAS